MKTRSDLSKNYLKIARVVPEDSAIQPRVQAEFDPKALQNNYRAIQDLVPDHSILPMIKANAYGHGAEWAAKLLQGFPALYGFGVATLEEGAEIRQALGPRARKLKIIVFSGTTPWSDEKGHFCEKYNLTAVIASDEDWHSFLRGGWPARISYELKFNTGMNRLGIHPPLARSIGRSLRNRPAHEHPSGIFSHLAMSENAEAKPSRLQAERFRALKAELSGAAPSALFHLANSAGIWNQKNWRLKGLTDVVRPGLSLYGIAPWEGAPVRGILPVMTLRASVVAVHRLKAGDSVGYGATFTVEGNEPVFVATIGAGYADGVHRSLSNRGHAWLGGRATRFVGRVSMDLSTVLCTAKTQVGEWVELIGPKVDPWAQAKAAGTIPYELLTSVSARVQRVYG